MTLWQKGYDVTREVARFTVQDDPILDLRLVPYDCRASVAHARMLQGIGVLTREELGVLEDALGEIVRDHASGNFAIAPEDEDCHTAIEQRLVSRCGDAGRRIHTARSRNDQVLVALRLYERDALAAVSAAALAFTQALGSAIDRWGDVRIPGYTHMRKAMPCSVAMWLGSYVEAGEDNERLLESARALVDQCPLGTAAGFGVPVLAIDRDVTAKELGFARITVNPLYAQLSRGKLESTVVHACTQVLFDLNRLATDLTLFGMTEFGFVELPEELCTGSSIMPQKKNPDVLELVRAKYHSVVGEEVKMKSMMANLLMGYNRDVQLTKGPLFAALDATLDCLGVMAHVVSRLRLVEERCTEALTDELFATERVYELVRQGVPFREAYQRIATPYRDK